MRRVVATHAGGVNAGGLPAIMLAAHGMKASDWWPGPCPAAAPQQDQGPARCREVQGRGSIFLGKERICFVLAGLNAFLTQQLLTDFFTCCGFCTLAVFLLASFPVKGTVGSININGGSMQGKYVCGEQRSCPNRGLSWAA